MTPLAQVHGVAMGQDSRPRASAAEIRGDAGECFLPASQANPSALSALRQPDPGRWLREGYWALPQRRSAGKRSANRPAFGHSQTCSPPPAVPLPSLTLQGGETPGRQEGVSSKHGYGHSASASAAAHAGPTGLASSPIWTVQATYMMLCIHVLCRLLLRPAIPLMLGAG